MLARKNSKKDWAAPEATYMSEKEKAQYLRDLRHQQPRPSGSRPLPPSKYTPSARTDRTTRGGPQIERVQPSLNKRYSLPVMPASHASPLRDTPNPAPRSPFAGRPLATAPVESDQESRSSKSSDKRVVYRTPSVYVENGTRWMEKQETRSLRRALEDMDLNEERKLHDAAQKEAAELVWKHQNPNAPYPNPERDYRSHLRKGSYQRSIADAASTLSGHRSASGGSQKSTGSDTSSVGPNEPAPAMKAPWRRVSPPSGSVSVQKRRSVPGLASYDGLAEAVAQDIANANRRTSNGSKRILSGEKKALFMHPNDQIWEDPQEISTPPRKTQVVEQPIKMATHVRKNPFARVKMQHDKLERANSMPNLPPSSAKLDHIEIQRNPPSQSRNAGYTSNVQLPPTPPEETQGGSSLTKDGMEIRGEDIRAATSKFRRDYSPNLPRPTMVSDKPGRPIVSFEQNWKPREVVLEERQSSAPAEVQSSSEPTVSVAPPRTNMRSDSSHEMASPGRQLPTPMINLPTAPDVPSIVLPDEPNGSNRAMHSAPNTPVIQIDAPPSINIRGPEPLSGPANPRPLPHHSASAPPPRLRSTPHLTPSIRQSGALCAECALPIAGRILSAAGQRFHPGCFACHQCRTNLEHVAFYPEPDAARAERLSRAFQDDGVAEPEGSMAADDADESPRFYCHLDFHELFSPRCKSCKTPIEGEVVVACGAEWHVGHFFCAQCGDPFAPTTPFVEKDGYAWCVGCHTNRYSSKCRKCRKPVTDVVVKALGADWHAECFVCTTCNGEFVDGRYFLLGQSQDPVCVRCEEIRLKA